MQILKKIFALLTAAERKRSALLMIMILLMALLDMLGVASILPFMAVLANFELLQTNPFLNKLFAASRHIGIRSNEEFLFALGVAVFVLLVASLAFKALTTYAQIRFALMREYSIGKRLVEGFLRQPYSWFLSRHSADLGKVILSEVGTCVAGGLVPLLTLLAQSAVAIALLVLLLVVDPILSVGVGLVLGASYAGIFAGLSNWLERLGQARILANKERFTIVSEAFGAAKEVKLSGLEEAYVRRFAKPAEVYAKGQASARVIGQLPRFALEAISFGGMLLVVLYLMTKNGSFADALPVIALYAFAGYRLLPALQQLYAALSQLRFVGPALDALHADMMSLQPVPGRTGHETIALKKAITLNNIHYRYPNSPHLAVKNLNLTIPAKSIVGFVGATGSGKTTTVDLILGLLEPEKGTLNVDGQSIGEHNRRAWQRAIGYVPQQFYLTDDTVASNIAFGVDPHDIDQSAVERAAKIANLHEFVISDLPHGYATIIGEHGVRLSGGQRQRISIARALYNKPQVLVLDEATSALDNLTEKAVMDAVSNLGNDITVILIAHRLSTVKECDTIFFLENGKLRAHGSFDELMQTNISFRAMAQSS